jgi:hypothetical protein
MLCTGYDVSNVLGIISNYFFLSLKGLSHEIFGPVFWAVWMYRGPNVNRFWFLNFNDAPMILDNSLSFDAFQAKQSPRFLESRRRIGN